MLAGGAVAGLKFVRRTRHENESFPKLDVDPRGAALSCERLRVDSDQANHPGSDTTQTTLAMTDSTVIPLGDSPVIGNPMAPVTVVLFSSPTCAFCELTRPLLFALQDRPPNEVRIVWNSWVNQTSPRAHNAALLEAFAQQNWTGFWKLYASLCETSPVAGEARPDGQLLELRRHRGTRR